MGYPAKAVANAFLQIAGEHGTSVTPLKLQKLVYIAHGWSLGLLDMPLVDDELPEAWQYGPVFPSIYHEFKEFGRETINKAATELSLNGPNLRFSIEEPEVPPDDKTTWALLKRVWDQYGKFGGIALSELTHRVGTPWDLTRNNSGGVRNADIDNDVIQAHYKDIIAKNKAKRAGQAEG